MGNVTVDNSGRSGVDEALLCRHYGFARELFSSRGEFLFLDAGRRQLLDRLEHVCLFGSALPLVLAAEGVGKTRLLRALEQRLAQEVRLCVVSAGRAQGVWSAIAAELGWSDLAADALSVEAFTARFEREQPSDGVVWILLDDAQLLDRSALIDLLSVHASVDLDLRFLLFGLPQLQADVERAEEASRAPVSVRDFELLSLSAAEQRGYLQERLLAYGYRGDLALLAGVSVDGAGNLKRLHESLYAQLRSVLAVAESNDGRDEIVDRGRWPIAHMGAIVLLLVVLGFASLFRGEGVESEVAVVGLSPEVLVIPEVMADSLGQAIVPGRQPKKEVGFSGREGLAEGVAEKSLGSQVELPPVEVVTDEGPLVERGVVELRPAESELTGRTAVGKFAVVSPVARVEPGLEGLAAAVAVELPALVAVPVISPESGPLASPDTLSADERDLLARDSASYGLQVLAAGSLASIRRFVVRQANGDSLRVYSSRRNGGAWFVVLQGSYGSASRARRAIGGLPAAQRQLSPWPKRLLDVQRDIRIFHGS